MLFFDGKPIRIVTLEDGGVPHFSLQDICEAVGWSEQFAAAKVDSLLFPAHGKRIATEHSDEGTSSVMVLTPVGVFYLADIIDAPKGQRVVAWAKREARRLHSEPRAGDPAVFLTLSPGGRLPPRPMKFSGYRSEWYDLRDANCALAHNPAKEQHEQRLAAFYEQEMMTRAAQRAAVEAA